MQSKQKITLYIPPELHRKLKIKAGKTHQIHLCPECDSPAVIRDGAMVALSSIDNAVEDSISLDVASQTGAGKPNEEELVSCI
jgi:hypothetical protein